jgi:RNA polymerase sigma-70 factor, ECF subfamily
MDATVTTTELSRSSEILAGLLGQVARKNERALAELYDRTSRLVYGLALRMVREQSAAEDIVQEVYMQVWRRGDTFDPARGTALSWMVTITRSRALDRLRSSKALESHENKGEELDTFRGPAPDPEHDERIQLVRRFLSQIPTDQRTVIELAFFHGLTHSEIASQTGLPLGTIKSRIRYGLMELREQLSFVERREQNLLPAVELCV